MASDEEVQKARDEVAKLRAQRDDLETTRAQNARELDNDTTMAALAREKEALKAEIAELKPQANKTAARAGAERAIDPEAVIAREEKAAQKATHTGEKE